MRGTTCRKREAGRGRRNGRPCRVVVLSAAKDLLFGHAPANSRSSAALTMTRGVGPFRVPRPAYRVPLPFATTRSWLHHGVGMARSRGQISLSVSPS